MCAGTAFLDVENAAVEKVLSLSGAEVEGGARIHVERFVGNKPRPKKDTPAS